MTAATLLETRLSGLPKKVEIPFRSLLDAGQLSQEVLTTILDAGDLAGDPQKLLGFAVGYLHLRSNGVPVKDVIEMARDQGRRIRLNWSAKRWRVEHERLSRAIALKKLADENVRYELGKFDSVIPDIFAGYLIRTSRRLGMEGLRQRHCVASYHQQLVNGYCALASVFVDRTRWTVQLALTGDEQRLLRIQQIRTRLNGNPSGDVKRRIYEMFGVEDIIRSGPGSRPPAPEDEGLYMENLQLLLPVLRENGSGNVSVSFDGCGDEGQVYGAEFDNKAFDADVVGVDCISPASHFEDGQWIQTREREETSVANAIVTLVDDYLEDTGVNWYDNDGGYGEFSINVDEGTVYMDVNVRFTESQSEFCSERDIVTGEEIA